LIQKDQLLTVHLKDKKEKFSNLTPFIKFPQEFNYLKITTLNQQAIMSIEWSAQMRVETLFILMFSQWIHPRYQLQPILKQLLSLLIK